MPDLTGVYIFEKYAMVISDKLVKALINAGWFIHAMNFFTGAGGFKLAIPLAEI
jgi:hypothetical protein